ncbi:MAG TPA: sugar phosphate isomerase/epimerase family protein [Devosiaceae bacterium]|nr:sugar phosphate isomerase/epimerase family protein [Devosiaceae bacterium]
MKLAFSTLGCPKWSFAEVLAKGPPYGFEGVAFRGLGTDELDLAKIPEFFPDRRGHTRRRLQEAGLAPSMMLTSARLLVEDDAAEDSFQLVRGAVDIAADLGAPFVRVFGGQIPGGLSHAAAVSRAGERLSRMAEAGARRGVIVLLETHDDFVLPSLVRRVMEAADHPNAGVLWDVHHPWRIAERPVAEACEMLKPWIKSVDLKDSVTDFSARLGYRYVKLGEGELPWREAIGLLKEAGYDGWLTFEWEKRWHPEIAAPEEAFPHFVATVRRELEA